MKIKDPERFERVCQLEEQNRRFPIKLFKFKKPLRQVDFNNYLDDYLDECDTGYCMK